MYVKTYVDIYTLRNATWSGAKENINILTDSDLEQILSILEEVAYDWDMTTLNDFFWFDCDTWSEWIGYDNFEELWNERYVTPMN